MTENRYISVRVYGNPSSNSGYQPIVLFNSPQFALADQVFGGIQQNSYFFTFKVEPTQTIFRLVKNNVHSKGASREGTLIIAISIPKGYKLAGGLSPYDVLIRLKDKFIESCMTLRDPLVGSYEYTSDIINPNVLDDTASMFTLVPYLGPHRSMNVNGNSVGCIEADEFKIAQLFRDVHYGEFANFSEIIVAPSVQSSSYVRIPNITIPRVPEYSLMENGRVQQVITDSKAVLTINGGRDPRFYNNSEVKFSVDDLLSGKSVTGLQIDVENEVITCDRSVLSTPKQHRVKITVMPQEMANKVRPSELAINCNGVQLPLNNDMSFTLTGDSIAALDRPQQFMVSYFGNEPYSIARQNVTPNELQVVFEKHVQRNIATPVAARDAGQGVSSGNFIEYTLSFPSTINLGKNKGIELTRDEEIVYRIYGLSRSTPRQRSNETLHRTKEGKYECVICIPRTWISAGTTISVEMPGHKCVFTSNINTRKTVINDFRLDENAPSDGSKRLVNIIIGVVIGFVLGFGAGYLVSSMGSKHEEQNDHTGRKTEQQQEQTQQKTQQKTEQKTEQQEQHANAHAFKCPQCDFRCDTEDKLTEHITETRHYFICEYCNSDKMGFSTKGELERHYNSPKCKKNQPQQTQQQNQRKAEQQTQQQQQQRQQQQRQQQQTQQQNQQKAEQQAEPAETFRCRRCGATFATRDERNQHQTSCTVSND